MHKRNLFFSILFMLFAGMLLSGCIYTGENNRGNRIEGEGPVRTKVLELDELHGVIIRNSANVYLRYGDRQKVEVEGQENIIRNLDTAVTNGIWNIRNKRPVWRTQRLNIFITLRDFRLLRISGSGNIIGESDFDNLDDVELVISGSGDIELKMVCDELYAKISGSGGIRIRGKGEHGDFNISGSGNIRAADFKVESARAGISGSGNMKIHVTEELDARISGSGDIEYTGRPRINSKSSGSGKIFSR